MQPRCVIMMAIVLALSLSFVSQAQAQSDATNRMALGQIERALQSCRQARPECGPLARWVWSAWVPEKDKPMLFAGGCLMDAHSLSGKLGAWPRGTYVHKRAQQAYEEVYAIAAARGASQCGKCPLNEFWVSAPGQALAKSNDSEAKSAVSRCRPDLNAQTRPPTVPPQATNWRAACRGEDENCDGQRDRDQRYTLRRILTEIEPGENRNRLHEQTDIIHEAGCSSLANQSQNARRNPTNIRTILDEAIRSYHHRCKGSGGRKRCPSATFWSGERVRRMLERCDRPDNVSLGCPYPGLIEVRDSCIRRLSRT